MPFPLRTEKDMGATCCDVCTKRSVKVWCLHKKSVGTFYAVIEMTVNSKCSIFYSVIFVHIRAIE